MNQDPKTSQLPVLNGKFLIFGQCRSGKSVLIDKLSGIYEPTKAYCYNRRSDKPRVTQLNDTLRKFVIPGHRYNHQDCQATTLNVELVEMGDIYGSVDKAPDEPNAVTNPLYGLADHLVPLHVSDGTNHNTEGTTTYLEGLPLNHNIMGSIWVIRSNILLSSSEAIVEQLEEALVREFALNSGSIFNEDTTGGLNDYTDSMVGSNFVKTFKDQMVLLYKQEMVLAANTATNEMMYIAHNPSFLGLPISIVLNVAQGAQDHELNTLTNDLVKKLHCPIQHIIKDCLNYAFALKCDIKSFAKMINYVQLNARICNYNQPMSPLANWFPTASVYRDYSSMKELGPASNNVKQYQTFWHTICPQSPVISFIADERSPTFYTTKYDDNLSSEHTQHDFDTQNARPAPLPNLKDITKYASYNEYMHQYYSKLPVKSDSVCLHSLSKNIPIVEPGTLLQPYQLSVPPVISLIATCLGDELTDHSVQRTTLEKQIYVHYRNAGTLVSPNIDTCTKYTCDRAECFLYNWLVDIVVWHTELADCSKVTFP